MVTLNQLTHRRTEMDLSTTAYINRGIKVNKQTLEDDRKANCKAMGMRYTKYGSREVMDKMIAINGAISEMEHNQIAALGFCV